MYILKNLWHNKNLPSAGPYKRRKLKTGQNKKNTEKMHFLLDFWEKCVILFNRKRKKKFDEIVTLKIWEKFLKKGKSREIGIAQNHGSKTDKVMNARLLRQTTVNPFVFKVYLRLCAG